MDDATITALERNWAMIDAAVDGLDDEMLARIPADHCLAHAWHLDRVMDTFVHTGLRSLTQVWVKEDWARKFGMGDDASDRGVGWTAEQVAAWTPPPRDILLGYYQAVRSTAREYLNSMTWDDLEKPVVWPPNSEPRTTAAALGQMTWDIVSHGGADCFPQGPVPGHGLARLALPRTVSVGAVQH